MTTGVVKTVVTAIPKIISNHLTTRNVEIQIPYPNRIFLILVKHFAPIFPSKI